MLTATSKSNSTKNYGFLVRALFIAVAVSGGIARDAGAQSFTPVGSTRVVNAQLGGVMNTILTVRKVGEPVRLEDGRFEQRYEVTANVPFRFVSSNAGENVKAADANGEVALAQLNGRAGFRNEFRIRAADQAALTVTAERRDAR